MSGQVCGLDVMACLARPSAADADAEALEWLLVCGEAGALTGIAKQQDTGSDGD